MKQTIQTIAEEQREWAGPKGTIVFLSGSFVDGSGWSLGCKPENVDKRRAEFTALVGVEGEYELEAKPEYKGIARWKIKSWPGKPVYGEGGGKKYEVAFRNTEAGFRAEQDMMNRRTALMQAVSVSVVAAQFDEVNLTNLAHTMYAWLSKTSGGPVVQAPSGATRGDVVNAPATGSSDSTSSPRMGERQTPATAVGPGMPGVGEDTIPGPSTAEGTRVEGGEKQPVGVDVTPPSAPGISAKRRVLLERVKEEHSLKNDASVLRLARGFGYKIGSLEDLTDGDLAKLADPKEDKRWTP